MLRQLFLTFLLIVILGVMGTLLSCSITTTTPEPTTSSGPPSLSEEARPKPSVAKKILDLHYTSGSSNFPPPLCDVNPDYAEPTIVTDTTSFHRQRYPGSRLSPFCVCGYKENETLTISVINPLDEVLLRQEAVVEPALDLGSRTSLIYCLIVDEIDGFDFLLSDPLGEYTVEIASQNARLTYNFDLVAFTRPVMYHSGREGSYVLAGFEPFEEVLILEYIGGRLTGEHELTLDQNGTGLWTRYNPEVTFFYIVREDLSLILTFPPTEEQLGTGVSDTSPPLDYDKIIEFYPDKAKYAYYQRVSEHISDDPIADLTKTIDLDSNYLPAYEERARYYEWQDNNDLAIADYSKMIEIDPTNLIAYQKRARLYEEQNDYDRAIVDYSEMIRLDPEAIYYYSRSRLYDYQGDNDQAIADYRTAIGFKESNYGGTFDDYSRAIELDPEFALAYYRRGMEYRSQGDKDEQAIADFSKAIAFKPDSIEFYRERARLYEKQSIYDLAIADYSKMIELASDDLPAYKERARLYEEQNNYDLAIADYKRMTEFAPNDLVAYRQQIRLYKRQGKDEQAITVYGNIIKRFPYYLPAYYERGLLHEKQGNNDQALADYGKIVEYAPENSAIAYYARGRIYEKQGSYETAATEYNKVIEIVPNEPIADYARGWLYAGQGDYNQAILAFTKAIERDNGGYIPAFERRDNWRYGSIADYSKVIDLIQWSLPAYEWLSLPAYERRAYLYEEQGHYDLAITDYSKMIELDPSNANYYSQTCWFGSLSGHAAEMMDICEQAVALDPENGDIRNSRGLAYVLNGDYGKAVEDFKFYINWLKNRPYEDDANNVETWIKKLELGQSPFDEITLEKLRNEYHAFPTSTFSSKSCVKISDVRKESPAQQAGLLIGDIILRLDETKISSSAEVFQYVRANTGRKIEFHILRDGQQLTNLVYARGESELPPDQGPTGIETQDGTVEIDNRWVSCEGH